jgi:hypothetical protein
MHLWRVALHHFIGHPPNRVQVAGIYGHCQACGVAFHLTRRR